MNRNQKIAIGCGAVGCLGLIVICIGVAGFLYWRSQQVVVRTSERVPFGINANSNTTSNRNSNSNSNTNSDSDSNGNDNESASNSSSSDGASASYSDDEKHRLFHAAGMSGDPELMAKVFKKIGIWTPNGVPGPGYQQFTKEHITWSISNTEFLVSIDTPEKAKAYIESHL